MLMKNRTTLMHAFNSSDMQSELQAMTSSYIETQSSSSHNNVSPEKHVVDSHKSFTVVAANSMTTTACSKACYSVLAIRTHVCATLIPGRRLACTLHYVNQIRRSWIYICWNRHKLVILSAPTPFTGVSNGWP
jgi:hypothetical protein